MSVQNVKVKCIRPIGYDNLREWMEGAENVYVARRGVVFVDGVRYPMTDSPFANPYKIGRDGSRSDVLEKYREWLEKQVSDGTISPEMIESLRGKTLGCWCAPEPCHAEILIDYLNANANASTDT